MCYKCEEHYGPSVTLSMDCVPCGNVFGHYGRFVYVLSQFVFATILYLLIVLFDVRLTKSPINCFLLFAQVIVNMLNYDAALYAHLQYAVSKSRFLEYSAKLVISFYGFLNLDLFPVILPPFCISSSLKGNHMFLLEYVVALYPLLLTALIYFLVSLYTRDVKPVVLVWRAVKYCMKPKLCCGVRWFLNKISPQDLANSFASFLLLSYSKLIFVSVSFLLPINLYTVGLNVTIPETVLYYDPPVQFFGPRHWPYAILSLSIFCLFVVLPLLLLFLYPLCVHSCVCVKYSSHSIRFFVENFQGWFKDRTEEGTRDFRLVSCVNPLLRITFGLSIMLMYVFVDPASGYFSARWFIPGFVFVATSLLFSIARPYKLEYMNSLETLLYSLLGVISFLASHRLGIYIIFLLCPIPMMVLVGYVVYLALKRLRTVFEVCCYRYVLNRCGNSETARLLPEGAVERLLPHRLENPELYNTRPTGPQSMNSFPPLLKKHTKDNYGAIY